MTWDEMCAREKLHTEIEQQQRDERARQHGWRLVPRIMRGKSVIIYGS